MLENDGGINLTWERDGIAKHSKAKSGAPVGMAPSALSTVEGQIMRRGSITYVNHDIDDATRRDSAAGSPEGSSPCWATRPRSGSALVRTSSPDAGRRADRNRMSGDVPGGPRARVPVRAVCEHVATLEFRRPESWWLWKGSRSRRLPRAERSMRTGWMSPRLHRRHDRSLRRPPVRQLYIRSRGRLRRLGGGNLVVGN